MYAPPPPAAYPPACGYAPPPGPPAYPPAPPRSPAWLKIAIVAAAVLAWWIYKGGLFEDPSTVVNAYLDGLQELDAEKVVATVAPSQRDAARRYVELVFIPLSAWHNAGATFAINNRQIRIGERASDCCVALVTYQLHVTAQGQQQNISKEERLRMLREDGHWYLSLER